ncbi:MAG: P44/Msp2 family outer membrane protein [Ehrlichia sp.]
MSNLKNFSVREAGRDVELIALKSDVTPARDVLEDPVNFNTYYSAKFKDSFASFSAAIGYHSCRGPRLEIEGSYENFGITNCRDCTVNDSNKYFALARGKELGAIQPKSHEGSGNSKKSFFTFMENNGISVASVMVNGCYDFSFDGTGISPYICAGVGGDFIEFFEIMHVKFSYQGKLGVSYLISPSISLFVDGYYHSIMNNEFKNLHVMYVHALRDSPTVTSAVAQLDIRYFGGEVGLRFIF